MLQFYLPYGTVVEVQYFMSDRWSTMNVYIFPSPNDMEATTGLCGVFNGNYKDDFLHRDGQTTAINGGYYWWWWIEGGDPETFAESWTYVF